MCTAVEIVVALVSQNMQKLSREYLSSLSFGDRCDDRVYVRIFCVIVGYCKPVQVKIV